MSRFLVALIIASLVLSGCGEALTIGKGSSAKTYPTYGIVNFGTSKSKNVCYEVSLGNVIWSILLLPTVVAPVYFVGFSLFNPVRLKKDADDDCGIDG